VDQPTRQIYETNAAEWKNRRSPHDLESATAFGQRTTGPSIDLGSGPGWYAQALPPPTVAFDAAKAMLDLVPIGLRVQGDLMALPFAPGTFNAAWARNSYVHLPRSALPLALAELHRATRVGGQVSLWLFGGEGEGRDLFEGDDFPGRYFSRWGDELPDIVGGGGFTIEGYETIDRPRGDQAIHIEATRARTLPDLVAPDMRLLVCGLNPSLYAADAGVGFARPGNRFWPAALAAGLVSVDRDPWHALRHHHVGFTDLVKRATVGAAELTRDEYRVGFARLERLARWLQPAAIAFVGLAGWGAAVDRNARPGWQEHRVGSCRAYVLPSTSGLNAHATVSSLTEHLQRAGHMT